MDITCATEQCSALSELRVEFYSNEFKRMIENNDYQLVIVPEITTKNNEETIS